MASLFNSPLITALLCMGIIFSLGSLLVSSITEWLNKFLKQRSLMLYDAIYSMFNDKVNVNFGKLLYSHPAIESMKRDRFNLPQYIPDKMFANVLIDVVADYAQVFAKNTDTGLIAPKRHDNEQIFSRFVAGIEKMQYTSLKAMLVNMVEKSAAEENDAKKIAALQMQLMDWYNGFMDRLSGWYKEKVRRRLFYISLTLALLVNLNAITLFRHFADNVDLAPEAVLQQPLPFGLHWDTLPLSIIHLNTVGEILSQSVIYLLGIFITAFAISRGAPFWFDLLSKIVNVRRAGIKPTPTSTH